MKLKLFTVIAIASSLNALELRLGNGTFEWDMSIAKFMNTSFDLDINTISLSEPHGAIAGTKLFYSLNADIYSSDFADQITTLMSYPVTYDFLFVGSINDAIDQYTPIPVPSSYKVRGFDLNLGVGYDFYKDEKGFAGVGVNTGLSMPVMEMKDLKKTAEFTYKVLEATKTHIKTYKLGPTLTGRYKMMPNLSAYGTFGFGYQIGTIENDWIRSSMDINGGYSVIDLGFTYRPLSQYPKLHISLGYSKKSWSMDEVKADMFDIFEVKSYGMLKNSFSSSSAYLGVGYTF